MKKRKLVTDTIKINGRVYHYPSLEYSKKNRLGLKKAMVQLKKALS